VYKGCFAADQLPHPNTIIYPAAFVVNLDPHEFEGSHWIAIYAYGRKREVIYYDSLSNSISPIIKENFLSFFPAGVVRNFIPYQNPFSIKCAHHCIAFIYFLSQGKTFTQFISALLSTNEPDFYVNSIVKLMIK
jgi:hypothetical protein